LTFMTSVIRFDLKGGINMNVKKIFLILVLAVAMFLSVNPMGWTQTKPGTTAPVITNSFAVEKGKYGYIWKIYIEAEDPDGDMLRIASVVDMVGGGRYPTDWTYIKPQDQKHFKGYLQWNTFSSAGSDLEEWTQITLKVSVFDKAGNESNVVVFPFTFESGVKGQYAYNVPAPFDQGDVKKLGYIDVNFIEVRRMAGGGSRSR
jgi:hypothetical protein